MSVSACHHIYLCGNKVVVRVALPQHGQQTLGGWNGLLEMRTTPQLKLLQDDFGSIQIASQNLQFFQRTAELRDEILGC